MYGCTATRSWPVQVPGINCNFELDITSRLNGDSIASVAVDVQPSGTGELQPISIGVNAGLITTQLSGGVAGREYVVRTTVTCVSGQVIPFLDLVPMDATLATWPIPYPSSFGFCTPISWSAGVTVLGPAFAAIANGLTAAAGGTVLPAATSIFTSVATNGYATLPLDIIAGEFEVWNQSGSDLPVQPPVGATINGQASIVVSAGQRVAFATQNPAVSWSAA